MPPGKTIPRANQRDSTVREQIIENQRIIDDLNEKILRKNNEIRIIQQISSEVNATLNLDRILETILRSMDVVLGFQHGMILLADEDEAKLELAACRGYNDPPIGLEIDVGRGVVGVVAKRRRMMRIGNLRAQKRYVKSVSSRVRQPENDAGSGEALPGLDDAQSQIAIPLVINEKLIGVFAVESAKANAFDELDEVLLSIVANHVANAIDNARLHQVEIDRSRELDSANAELLRLNETLEMKVRERTAELSGVLDEIRQEKELSEKLLSRMAPPEVIPLMLEDSLAPRRLMASILFADLEGFTGFTSGMEPDEVFARLNDFFSWAGDIISRYRGYLNKTNGDGIMALFGVPEGSPTHASDAVLTALSFQRELHEVLPLGMRIGISSGPITTGLLGPQDKSMYDALGASVNAASRMEGLSETGTIMISSGTYDLVKPYFSIQALGRQEVKGFDPADCYQVHELKPLMEDTRRVDPTSMFAREHDAAVRDMARVHDDVLAMVNFVSIQSRDGAIGHNGAVAAFALAFLRMLKGSNVEALAERCRAIAEEDLLKVALLHDIGKHAVDLKRLNATNLDAHGRDDLRAALKAETLKALEKLGFEEHVPAVEEIYGFEASGGAGGQYSPLAEIVCLADIYDALTAPKVYKGASWQIGGALEELLRLPCYDEGDMAIARAFVELMRPAAIQVARRRKVRMVLE